MFLVPRTHRTNACSVHASRVFIPRTPRVHSLSHARFNSAHRACSCTCTTCVCVCVRPLSSRGKAQAVQDLLRPLMTLRCCSLHHLSPLLSQSGSGVRRASGQDTAQQARKQCTRSVSVSEQTDCTMGETCIRHDRKHCARSVLEFHDRSIAWRKESMQTGEALCGVRAAAQRESRVATCLSPLRGARARGCTAPSHALAGEHAACQHTPTYGSTRRHTAYGIRMRASDTPLRSFQHSKATRRSTTRLVHSLQPSTRPETGARWTQGGRRES